MEKIDFRKQKVPFTQVANDVLNDRNLSMRAKGLFAYIYSKPDGWDFSYKRIAEDHKDGKSAVLSALKELEKRGCLKRQKMNTGRVEYFLTYEPSTENRSQASKPDTEIPYLGNTLLGKIGTISNKEAEVIKSSNKEKSRAKAPQGLTALEFQNLIDNFKPINPLYLDFYRNTTQRKALESIAKQITYEKLLNTILALPDIVSRPFAPKITTPVELKRDLGKLVLFVKQEGMRFSKKTNAIATIT